VLRNFCCQIRNHSLQTYKGCQIPCPKKLFNICFSVLFIKRVISLTREWYSLAGRYNTWNFSHLRSPSTSDWTQNFSCRYEVQGCKKFHRLEMYSSNSCQCARAWRQIAWQWGCIPGASERCTWARLWPGYENLYTRRTGAHTRTNAQYMYWTSTYTGNSARFTPTLTKLQLKALRYDGLKKNALA
jgi:hypothetical protein